MRVMKRSWVLGGGAVAAVVVWSCVSDQPSGPAAGADGGVCFSNGTCSAGLVCTSPQGNGICIPGGSDAAMQMDGPASDAGPEDSSTDGDAGVACPPIVIDASQLLALSPQCMYGTCFPFGGDAEACQAMTTYACPGEGDAGAFSLQHGGPGSYGCLGADTRDGGTCCLTDGTNPLNVVDAACSLDIVLAPTVIGFERFGDCRFGTGSPADMLCTSDQTCQAHFTAPADAAPDAPWNPHCVPAVFSGGTALDGVYTGICQ